MEKVKNEEKENGQREYLVGSNLYQTRFRFLTDDLQYMERDHQIDKGKLSWDSFPKDWFLFLSDQPKGQIQLNSPFEDIDLEPPVALFLPPFSIVHWKIGAGRMRWKAFRSRMPIPQQNHILVFPWNFSARFSSSCDLFDLINTKKSSAQQLSFNWNSSHLAHRTKKFIDDTFAEDFSMSQIASSLGTTNSGLTHAFKTCFRISPVQYRNHLRIHESLRLQSWHRRNVTDSCFESGFSDFSRFFRQFKGTFGQPPSTFSLKTDAQKV